MRHRNILRKVSHAKFPLMAELDDTIRKNNLFFRQLLFLSVLILMGVVMLRELSFIIGSFLGAITLYIVFRPLQYRLIDRYRWRPWLASLLLVFLALLVLAIGAGSVFFSHLNDAGFWLVKEYFGMTVGQTLKTWSLMETVLSVVGLGGVMLLSLVL